jgi:heme exporter protein CcmD
MSHFTNCHDFLLMGGYAKYVWPAYAITFIVLLGNVCVALKKRHGSRS